MGPDIGAVVVHEDRDVAHDAHRAKSAMVPQCAPLLSEGELQSAAPDQFLAHLAANTIERGRLAESEVARPFVPVRQLMLRPQSIEEDEVVEPIFVLGAEALEAGASVSPHGLREVARG